MGRLCIFGDSITWGGNDWEGGGWAARLKKYIETNDYDVSVYNLGISGDTTDDLLERFDIEARAREPETIIFAIGVNDASLRESLGGNKVAFDKFKNNLDNLFEKSNSFTKKIIFVGLLAVDESKVNPKPWNTDSFLKNETIKEYNQAIKDLCEKNNLPFIEMYDLLGKEDLDDGLHPNSKGHEKMFLRVRDFLIENKAIN